MIKMSSSIHVNFQLVCQIFVKLVFSRHIFEKFPNIKFHENPCSGMRFFDEDRRTDRHNEANSRSSQFCERA